MCHSRWVGLCHASFYTTARRVWSFRRASYYLIPIPNWCYFSERNVGCRGQCLPHLPFPVCENLLVSTHVIAIILSSSPAKNS